MNVRNAVAAVVASASLMLSAVAAAHCDSVDGPVVRDARTALDERDPNVVLKWVGADKETEIREAFAKTLAVRELGQEAKELADTWFFETLVRLHRAGEGEPFTGLKPAGQIDDGIVAADAALEAGSAAAGRLAKRLAEAVEVGVRTRASLALERKRHADESSAAGREYVSAYVDYIHFVERINQLAQKGVPHSHTADESD